MELPDLIPCPFCAGTETQIRKNPHWAGRSSTILSVDLIHWCNEAPFTSIIKIRGRTEEEVITKWNSRVGAFA